MDEKVVVLKEVAIVKEDVLTLHVSSREVFDLARLQITMGQIIRELSKRCYSRFGRYPTKDEEREFYITVRQYRIDHGLTVLKGKKRQREPSQSKEIRYRQNS